MIFPSFGVRFIAINDDVDSENSRAGDDIIIPVKNIMNEAYCRELSKKLRKQFQIQRGNGEFLGAFANYGYCKSPDDKHKLVVDDYAAEVVRGIFSLKFQGYNQQAIADFLNNEKVLSPADYKKSQGLKYKTGFRTSSESHWSAVSVSRILTNPIYTGKLVQGKRGTPNYKIKTMRMREEKDWVVVENNHDPIIDPLTFMIVQRMLERDTRTAPQNDIVYPLSGMVFCADCGAKLYQVRGRNLPQSEYMVCATYRKRGKEVCSSHQIRNSVIEEFLLDGIRNVTAYVREHEDAFVEMVTKLSKAETEKTLRDEKREQAQTRIHKLDTIIQRLYEDNVEGKISDERFAKMSESYEAEQKTLEERITVLRGNIVAQQENRVNVDSFIALVRKHTDIRELNAEIIREFVERIEVFQAERVCGKKVQKLRIVWNCIGSFNPPQPDGKGKTA